MDTTLSPLPKNIPFFITETISIEEILEYKNKNMNKVLNVCVTLHKQLVAHLGLHSEKTGLCKKRECMYIYIYKPTYDDTINSL